MRHLVVHRTDSSPAEGHSELARFSVVDATSGQEVCAGRLDEVLEHLGRIAAEREKQARRKELLALPPATRETA